MPQKGKAEHGPAGSLGHLSSSGVAFKGYRHGLKLVLPAEGDFAAVCEDLQAKLAGAEGFFHGATVLLDPTNRALTATEVEDLQALMTRNGLVLLTEEPAVSAALEPGEVTETVRGPLRTGQRVGSEGNILILGDVHPGAEVLAGRDAVILGAVRGNIAAGLISGREASVIAFQLRPSLLRLGDLTARSPGGGPGWRAEIAHVHEGRIVVEPFLGWQRLESRRPRHA